MGINNKNEMELYVGLNKEGTLDIHIAYDVKEKQYSIFYFIESIKDEQHAFFWSYAVDETEATLGEVIEEARECILDRATSEQIARMSTVALMQLKTNQAMLVA